VRSRKNFDGYGYHRMETGRSRRSMSMMFFEAPVAS